MVQYERAATHKLKAHLKKKLTKIGIDATQLSKRLSKEADLTELQQSVFYSSWLYSAIRLSTSLNEPQTLDSLQERFNLSREKVVGILNFLTSTGLVVENLGQYQMGPQRTHLDKSSPFITRHHANWRHRAILRSEELSDEELMFTGPLSISKADFKIVREEIVSLIAKISSLVKETEAEELAVFEVELFWMK